MIICTHPLDGNMLDCNQARSASWICLWWTVMSSNTSRPHRMRNHLWVMVGIPFCHWRKQRQCRKSRIPKYKLQSALRTIHRTSFRPYLLGGIFIAQIVIVLAKISWTNYFGRTTRLYEPTMNWPRSSYSYYDIYGVLSLTKAVIH